MTMTKTKNGTIVDNGQTVIIGRKRTVRTVRDIRTFRGIHSGIVRVNGATINVYRAMSGVWMVYQGILYPVSNIRAANNQMVLCDVERT
jgi:hypothetical protein